MFTTHSYFEAYDGVRWTRIPNTLNDAGLAALAQRTINMGTAFTTSTLTFFSGTSQFAGTVTQSDVTGGYQWEVIDTTNAPRSVGTGLAVEARLAGTAIATGTITTPTVIAGLRWTLTVSGVSGDALNQVLDLIVGATGVQVQGQIQYVTGNSDAPSRDPDQNTWVTLSQTVSASADAAVATFEALNAGLTVDVDDWRLMHEYGAGGGPRNTGPIQFFRRAAREGRFRAGDGFRVTATWAAG